MSSKLLTTAETAQVLSRPIATLRYWIVRGEAPDSFLIGRRRMFREEAVERWIADREKASA